MAVLIAICTREMCWLRGQPRYWPVEDTADALAYLDEDPPAFCPECGSPVIKGCPNCNRSIRDSDLRNNFCVACGERLRFPAEE